MTRSEKKKRYDGMLIFVVLLLVAAGLVILYSTSAYNGQVKFHDPFHYLKKQGFATLLGLFGMALIARVDYHKWVPLAIPAYVTSIILSVAVIFFGDEYNGSKRWLSLGPISFQPSEFAKVAVIFFLACLVSRNVQRIQEHQNRKRICNDRIKSYICDQERKKRKNHCPHTIRRSVRKYLFKRLPTACNKADRCFQTCHRKNQR